MKILKKKLSFSNSGSGKGSYNRTGSGAMSWPKSWCMNEEGWDKFGSRCNYIFTSTSDGWNFSSSGYSQFDD